MLAVVVAHIKSFTGDLMSHTVDTTENFIDTVVSEVSDLPKEMCSCLVDITDEVVDTNTD